MEAGIVPVQEFDFHRADITARATDIPPYGAGGHSKRRSKPAQGRMIKESIPLFGTDALALRTSFGPAWVVDSVECIPAHLRETSFATRCKDFRYYEVLEASLSEQFEFRCFVLHNESSGEWALQPLFFVHQDLLAGLPQALRAPFTQIRKCWPGFLKMRMMMIGLRGG